MEKEMIIKNYKLWLESLKVGDKVGVEISSYGTTKIAFTEITKITPKKSIRLKWNENYLFKDGYADSGGKWSITSYHIIEITNELIQKENKRRRIEKISTFKDWEKLEADDINQIYTIIFKPQAGRT